MKNEKSMSKNAIFNMFNKFLTIVFPLVTISYVSRILGANGIGIVSSIQNFSTYFMMVAALGIPSYGVRAIAQSKFNKEKSNLVFTELFILNLLSTLICVVLYFLFINFIIEIEFDKRLYYIFSSLVIFNIFNIEWVYQGFEEYSYITIRNFTIKLLSLFMLFIFVRNQNDIIGYSLILCFGTVGNYILNMINVKKFVWFDFKEIDIKKHIEPVFTFFGSVLAIEIYSLLDITMLTYFSNPTCVGYYSNSTKIVKTIAGTVTAISAVLLPRLSQYFIEKNNEKVKEVSLKFLDLTYLLTVPCMIGLFLLADQIVLCLLGENFIPSIMTIRILSFLILFMPLSGGVFCQLLLTSGREKKYLCSVLIGAVVNVILNLILIPKFLQNGAAFASVISEIIVCISMILFTKQFIDIKTKFKSKINIFGASTLLGISVLIIKFLCNIFNINLFISLIFEISTGIFIYFGILILIKNEFIIGLIRKFF